MRETYDKNFPNPTSLHLIRVISLMALMLWQIYPAAARATEKIVHVLLVSPEAALDPAIATDLQSLSINENIFDTMLRYDYLARPLKLQPNTLQTMPEISGQGKSYLLKLRPGIYFSEDPAFGNRRRELTAQDYVYSIKRLYDPALKSPWRYLFAGSILGDEVLQVQGRAFAIDAPVAGLQALDRYTLRIRLNTADRNFLFKLTMPAAAAVAREVVERYAGQSGNHPVGTGPFRIGQWQRSFRLELLANPDYHGVFHSDARPENEQERQVLKNLQGRRLPLVDKIDIKIVEEAQARVLGFLRGEFDYLEQVPPQLGDMLMHDGKLKPELLAQNVQLNLFIPMQTYYMWMNMEDPVLGGYTPQKIALRRAIALSYNSQEDIRLMEKGLAVPAQSPVPPDVLGYDADYRNPVVHDLQMANALLDKFGYGRRDQQGFRLQENGQPLQLQMMNLSDGVGHLRDEIWRKNLQAIGIRVSFTHDKHGEILKAARLGKVQMTEANWIADFPDADNFYQLLYGPNTGAANYARFNLPEFNQRYVQANNLPDGPQRQKIYDEMAQLINTYNPWVLRIHPLSADVWHGRLKNYVRHPVAFTTWRYLDVTGD